MMKWKCCPRKNYRHIGVSEAPISTNIADNFTIVIRPVNNHFYYFSRQAVLYTRYVISNYYYWARYWGYASVIDWMFLSTS